MPNILIVEDEDILRETYELILSSQPYSVSSAENGQIALEMCQTTSYDLILLDLMMPVLTGLGFLEQFMPTAPVSTHIILMTNLSSGIELDAALRLGVTRNVLKAALSPAQLLTLIRDELSSENQNTVK